MYALGHGKFETLKHNSTSANLIPVGITDLWFALVQSRDEAVIKTLTPSRLYIG